MNYLRLALFFLFDIIFLQWIKVIISIIIKVLYNPNISMTDYDVYAEEQFHSNGDKINLHHLQPEHLENMNLDAVVADEDGFKQLTILAGALVQTDNYNLHATNQTNRNIYGKLVLLLFSYWDKYGIIGRLPVDNKERYNNVNFSGDMLSGFLYWVAAELTSDKLKSAFICMPLEIKEKLIKWFNNTTFESKDPFGNSKRLLTFVNANKSPENPFVIEPQTDDRGYIFRIYGLGPDLIRLLTWLYIGYQITEEKRYLILYKFLKIGYFPLYLANSVDYGIFFKRYMCISWYTIHSNFYAHMAHLLLTNSTTIKDKLQEIVNRHPSNVCINIAWYKYLSRNCIPAAKKLVIYYSYFLSLMLDKGRDAATVVLSTYVDLKKRRTVEMSSRYLLPTSLGNKYMWENNPLKVNLCDDQRRQKFKVDYYICLAHAID